MNSLLVRSLFLVLAVVLMVAIAVYVPNPLPAHSDFSALYNTDLALVNRVPIYDLEAVETLAQKASGLPPEKFFLARFPYPPWYALATFFLGWMPAKAAATLWFEINLLMLFISVWFLTDGWDGRLRLLAFPAALIFFPVLGALSVGQYDFPVLLGISMLMYSMRRENILLTVFGAILLTFKPHIGALVLLSVLILLIARRDAFGRRSFQWIVIAGVALFAFGFLADPAWVVNYPRMLLNYQGEGNVSSCSECASLPVYLSRWFLNGSLKVAAQIALLLLGALAGFFFTIRKKLFKTPAWLLTYALLSTLLVSPYLYNYDFLLLLVPFAVLCAPPIRLQRIVVILCHLAATTAIIVYGRAGNASLLIATMILAIMFYVHVRNLALTLPGLKHTMQT